MTTFLQIQPKMFCENCKDCGARPVLEQVKGKYIVLCPNNKNHYRTRPGFIDVNDWNLRNRVQKPLVMTPMPAQKAS